MTMKHKILFLLLILLTLISKIAFATDLEIIYPNVNFRSEPGGKVIGTFAGGEMLNALDESWANNQLWYHAHSDEMGDGYVSGDYARPIWVDERIFDPENPARIDYVTENVLAFYESLHRYLYQFAFCYWDPEEGGCTFRVKNGVGDSNIVRPSTKWDLAYMLLRYGLLVENEETSLLRYENDSDEERKLQISSAALKNHFGTDDVWEIIIRSKLLIGSEAHAPHCQLSNRDQAQLSDVRKRVDAEYCRMRLGSGDDSSIDRNLLLFYNPYGGSKYHTDPNCPSTSSKYLPFAGCFTWEAVNAEEFIRLLPCNVCNAPAR